MEKKPIQTFESIQAVVNDISFRDWIIFLGGKDEEAPWLQIHFLDKDFYTKRRELQKCRKWRLSYFMVNSEIVRSAKKAVDAAMIHEVDETFTYKGVRPYHPHMDIDELVRLYKASNGKLISVRPDQNVIPQNQEPVPAPLIVEEEIGGPKEVADRYRKIFHGTES